VGIEGGAAISVVYYLYGVMHLVLGFVELTRFKNRLSRLFALHFFDFSAQNIYYGLYLSGDLGRWPHLYGTVYPLVPLIFILNYLIVQYLLKPRYQLTLFDKINILIPFATILYLLPLYQSTKEQKINYYIAYLPQETYYGLPTPYTRDFISIYTAFLTIFTVYTIYKKINFKELIPKVRQGKYPKEIFFILAPFFTISLLFVAGFQLGVYTKILTLSFISSVMLNLNWIIFYFFVRIAPYFFQVAVVEVPGKSFNIKHYFKSRLSKINIEELKERLHNECVLKYYFKNEKANRDELAALVQITPEQLSEYLNSYLEKSFNEYINNLRINEAKKLLVKNSDLNTTRIGYEAGFGSSSAWHKVFKEATGMTPEEYRKNGLSNTNEAHQERSSGL